MNNSVKRIAVTGAAGQIAYSLLFRLASGELLGPDQQIALHLLEIPEAVKFLKGVEMELGDCAFPLLKEIKIGSDPFDVFNGCDLFFFVGSKPRAKGMERKDLLFENGKIFVEQGKALDASSNKDIHALVVGNPCNTNCLILQHHARSIDPKRFYAMTRLDENRAKYQLSFKAGVLISEVTQMTIWGNHSSTQVPDFTHALIEGKNAIDVIRDEKWLKGEFLSTVQKRGAAIIEARGKSSAASAASSAIDSMKSVLEGDLWHSLGIHSKGNPYGIDENLIFSFPVQKGSNIIKDLEWNAWLEEKIKLTEKELIEERNSIEKML